MDRKKIDEYLEQLRQEISSMEGTDAEASSRLRALTGQIEAAVKTSPGDSGDSDILDTIQAGIENFETEHPAITDVLNRIATLLGNMGI